MNKILIHSIKVVQLVKIHTKVTELKREPLRYEQKIKTLKNKRM